jgi:predicted  nucleic acid-binding Zn-ribbon protein
MNENFKKVMDAIAEMKSLFTSSTDGVTDEVTTSFGEAVLMDGTAIAYEGDLAVGSRIFVVADGEQIPAPEGTHALGGEYEGMSIVTDASGVVVEIVDERAAQASAASSEETTSESMSAEQVEAIVISKMESFSTVVESLGEMLQTIVSDNESLRTEMAAMKSEFDAFKAAPSNGTTEGEKFARVTSTLTARQQFLKSQIKG